MNEITVEKVSYSGNGIGTTLRDEMSDGEQPEFVRLDVYIDDANIREPFLIRSPPGTFHSGNWSIGRCWPYDSKIRFELWARPQSAPEREDHDEAHTKVATKTVQIANQTSVQTADFGHPEFSITFSVGPAPDSQYKNVADPSGNQTLQKLYRTPAIQSAMADFDPAEDEGLSFISEENIIDAADDLSNRVDIIGIDGNTPDGIPDSAVELADQDHHPFCAAAALIFALAVHRPRRAVEFCRSVYDPIAVGAHGEPQFGFLTGPTTVILPVGEIEDFYKSQINDEKRSTFQATFDVLIVLIRLTLAKLPAITYDSEERDQYRKIGDGLADEETAAVLSDFIGIENVSSTENHIGSVDIETILSSAGNAAGNERVSMLGINSDLIRPDRPTASELDDETDQAVVNHYISIIDVTKNQDDTYHIVFQSPWGGHLGEDTIHKSVLDKYVGSVVYEDDSSGGP